MSDEVFASLSPSDVRILCDFGADCLVRSFDNIFNLVVDSFSCLDDEDSLDFDSFDF